eukprot:Clim_evm50s236 gene=Clim_evmTU50s236
MTSTVKNPAYAKLARSGSQTLNDATKERIKSVKSSDDLSGLLQDHNGRATADLSEETKERLAAYARTRLRQENIPVPKSSKLTVFGGSDKKRDSVMLDDRENESGTGLPPVFKTRLDVVLTNPGALSVVALDGKTCSDGSDVELYIPRLVYELVTRLGACEVPKGLFRMSGSSSRINAARYAVDQGQYQCLEDLTPHDCAGLLKLYLRELPEPLVPVNLYETFLAVAAMKDKTRRHEMTRLAVFLLPRTHRHLLVYLLRYFHDLTQSKDTHKMTMQNLATCIAPNMYRRVASTDPRDGKKTALPEQRDVADHGFMLRSFMDLLELSDSIGLIIDPSGQGDDEVSMAISTGSLEGRRGNGTNGAPVSKDHAKLGTAQYLQRARNNSTSGTGRMHRASSSVGDVRVDHLRAFRQSSYDATDFPDIVNASIEVKNRNYKPQPPKRGDSSPAMPHKATGMAASRRSSQQSIGIGGAHKAKIQGSTINPSMPTNTIGSAAERSKRLSVQAGASDAELLSKVSTQPPPKQTATVKRRHSLRDRLGRKGSLGRKGVAPQKRRDPSVDSFSYDANSAQPVLRGHSGNKRGTQQNFNSEIILDGPHDKENMGNVMKQQLRGSANTKPMNGISKGRPSSGGLARPRKPQGQSKMGELGTKIRTSLGAITRRLSSSGKPPAHIVQGQR